MANIKSQIKRNRQNERARVRNKAVRSRLKTEIKKVRTAAEGGDAQAATEQLLSTTRLIDKAASSGVIHKRTAARRKSKLARAVASDASSSS